jgi:DNA-binding protein HU-beta
MNKADLTDDLAKKTGLPKIRAAVYVNHLMDSIQDALTRGEKVTISDFGTFQVSERKAFTGNNPKTQEKIEVPMRRIPVFRAGKGLKDALNVVK